jgi:hypothetical protein
MLVNIGQSGAASTNWPKRCGKKARLGAQAEPRKLCLRSATDLQPLVFRVIVLWDKNLCIVNLTKLVWKLS